MIKDVMTDEELQTVARLAVPIWREAFAGMITREQTDYMLEKFQSYEALARQCEEEGYHYMLCMLDGKAVGYCGVQPQEDGTLYLSKMYLLAQARGHGLFTEMVVHLKSYCRNRGLRSIWLTVNKNNARAIAAYGKNGFRNIRSQVSDIGHGFVMDDYVFELEVS